MKTYHFGVPEWIVWLSNIMIGAFLVYVGYALVLRQRIPLTAALALLVLGVLAILYHGHIWLVDEDEDADEDADEKDDKKAKSS